MTLHFHNTLTRRKEALVPIDAANVRLYACGPTVYDRPHIGNARSAVVYDVLFRLLNQAYGAAHVTYVRNITDVDDKINARAKELGISIQQLTGEVTKQFHADMDALNVLRPTHEPRATAHVPTMIALIEQLIAHGNAYESEGHVLFAVTSYKDYGKLSGRKLDELVAGARVEVESYKHHPGDFVLWKPAGAGDDPSSVFDSPWGAGRPGWHIECSAMSSTYLGDTFDLHGGGADLMFPHHENEIAQSCCAEPGSHFARMWVHNGFLTVNGEKMSKSLGNFITVHDLLARGVRGEVIRYALLSTKYNEPLDWSDKLLEDAKKALDKWYRVLGGQGSGGRGQENTDLRSLTSDPFLEALRDDLNTPKALSLMHAAQPGELKAMGELLGFFTVSSQDWFKGLVTGTLNVQLGNFRGGAYSDAEIDKLIADRAAAKKAKNFAEADRLRKELTEQGILLEDRPDGTTDWRRA
jgi:cysteinyl-tRNA synthetase